MTITIWKLDDRAFRADQAAGADVLAQQGTVHKAGYRNRHAHRQTNACDAPKNLDPAGCVLQAELIIIRDTLKGSGKDHLAALKRFAFDLSPIRQL